MDGLFIFMNYIFNWKQRYIIALFECIPNQKKWQIYMLSPLTRYLPVNGVFPVVFSNSNSFFLAGDKCCVAVNWKRKKWWNNQHQTRQWSNTVLWYVIKIQWNLNKPHYSKQILTVPWAFVIWSSTVLWNCKSHVLSYMFAGMSLIASCQLHVVSLAE